MTLYTKTTLHSAMIWPSVTIICFKIWNWSWWCSLSTMITNSSLVCWCWKSFLFNSLWRRKLQWRHIRSRLTWVGKGCTFHWCTDCGKYCCSICWGQKLLGWPLYVCERPPLKYTQNHVCRNLYTGVCTVPDWYSCLCERSLTPS